MEEEGSVHTPTELAEGETALAISMGEVSVPRERAGGDPVQCVALEHQGEAGVPAGDTEPIHNQAVVPVGPPACAAFPEGSLRVGLGGEWVPLPSQELP
eukprot:94247-Amphidinium_carterae.1